MFLTGLIVAGRGADVFDWMKKPAAARHPLYDAKAVGAMLADLPADKPQTALDEISRWVTSVAEETDFPAERRVEVLYALEGGATAFEAEVVAKYLGDPHLRSISGRLTWQAVVNFWTALASAYEACVLQQVPDALLAESQRLAPGRLAARALRARSLQLRSILLHYEVEPAAYWHSVYGVYRRCEAAGIAGVPVTMAPEDRYHSSVQLELLKCLLLEIAAPETLPPEQIELGYLVVSKFCGSGEISAEPGDAAYCFDLAGQCPPLQTRGGVAHTLSMRYLDTGRALKKLHDMIAHHAAGMLDEDERRSRQYSPGQRISLLRHFMTYWGSQPPQRDRERVRITGELSVVHGYSSICHYISHVDAGDVSESGDTMDSRIRKRADVSLKEEVEIVQAEPWDENDAGKRTVRATVPAGRGDWAEVGDLCAIKLHNKADWWLAVVRRLHLIGAGALEAEFEILSLKPLAVWLRMLGGEGTLAANWETSSGSFSFDFLHCILLTDRNQPDKPQLLVLPANSYVPGHISELLAGQKRRHLQFKDFLQQGKDYDLGTFDWMGKPGR